MFTEVKLIFMCRKFNSYTNYCIRPVCHFLLLESPCSLVSHRISQCIYDANIIPNVRCGQDDDDDHHNMYDAIIMMTIIICVQCDTGVFFATNYLGHVGVPGQSWRKLDHPHPQYTWVFRRAECKWVQISQRKRSQNLHGKKIGWLPSKFLFSYMDSGPWGIFWPKRHSREHLEHPEKVGFLTERGRKRVKERH